VTGIPCVAGDVIRIQAPNGAGYGDPLERDPVQVREDVLDDFTTIELARDAYGVVFSDGKNLEIDPVATAAERERMRSNQASTTTTPSSTATG
jgi:N-methylhydantoinase B